MEVTALYKGKIVSLPIMLYQDHSDCLPKGVKLLHSEVEVWCELADPDTETCYLLAPLSNKNQEVDKAHIIMEAQPQEIKDKVLKVPKEYQESICTLLEEFKTLFPIDLPINELPDHPIKHVIVVDPTKPIPQHWLYKEETLIETTLKYLLDHGLIRESDSPYASPVLVVPKKDDTFLFCIDYHMLNQITSVDSFRSHKSTIFVTNY